MRIDKAARTRIVRSVMGDIPFINYDELAQNEALTAAVDALPPAVRKVWDDPKTREFIKIGRVYSNCHGISANVPSTDDYRVRLPEPAWAAFKVRCGEKRAQKEKRDELQRALEANLASVTTRKALIERFPDLAAYLPTESATPNLPATNDLADRLKAAGWAPGAK